MAPAFPDPSSPSLPEGAGGTDAALPPLWEALDRPLAIAAGPNGLPRVMADGTGGAALIAQIPASPPESLGDPSFREAYGVRYAYVGGAMANGIASVELVTALAHAGMIGFFGAAGLTIPDVIQALDRLQSLGSLPYGVNFIHSPGEPRVERELAELLINRRVPAIEASAFLDLTPALVRLRVAGLRTGPNGEPIPARRLMAKVSRREVAARFLAPPPAEMLDELLRTGEITADERRLAAHLPMCDDLTAEADSGGHTDNRPLVTLLPSLIALRDEIATQYPRLPRARVGAAGGIGTPWAAHAAFSLGAAYLVIGSVHQSCKEAGTSDAVRRALAETAPTDVAMAPAADMFEMGVELQVLRRGTMFPMRARQLYELYRRYSSWEEIPAAERTKVERTQFRASFEEIWQETERFFLARDPEQVERATNDPKHRMALVFRWYLGLSSAWANRGDAERTLDYQVWCGPAMGAFNEWVAGTPLAEPSARSAPTIALALLDGAARCARLDLLRRAGVPLSPAPAIRPRLVPSTPDSTARTLA